MKAKSILLGIGIVISIFLLSCTMGVNNFSSIKGSGKIIKEIRVVNSFNSIKAGSAFEIIITKGDIQKLILEADDNIMEKITSSVNNGELKLNLKGSIKNPTKMKVTITIPELKGIDLSGACELISKSRFDNDEMVIGLSGASDAELKVKCNYIDIDMSGASKLKISGFAAKQNIEASGACGLKAFNLESDIADINCSGAASVKVFVRKTIMGGASGASNVYYRGNPNKIMVDKSGAASFSKD